MTLPIHTALGVLALVAGGWNLVAPKGTRFHRLMGGVYAVSMIGLILTSFAIFELTGAFGPFHVMSIVSGVTLALALYFPLRREHHEGWLEHHYFWISYSYVGLVTATGSHLAQYNLLGLPFWARAVLYWGVPLLVGSVLIFQKQDAVLGRVKAFYAQASDA